MFVFVTGADGVQSSAISPCHTHVRGAFAACQLLRTKLSKRQIYESLILCLPFGLKLLQKRCVLQAPEGTGFVRGRVAGPKIVGGVLGHSVHQNLMGKGQ
jgi:hypothetical protein